MRAGELHPDGLRCWGQSPGGQESKETHPQLSIPSTNAICILLGGTSVQLQPAARLPKLSPSTWPQVTETPYLFPAERDVVKFQSPGAGDPRWASPAGPCWEVQREDMDSLSAVTVRGVKSPTRNKLCNLREIL